MTALTTRPCKLGTTQNRPEKHGNETRPALSIPLSGILLEKDEVDELVGAGYWNSIFEVRTGKAHTRCFPKVKAHELEGKYAGSIALVMGANQKDIERDGVTLTKITLAPLEGGLVAMSLDVQTNEDPEKIVGKLIARMDSEVSVELEVGEKAERAKGRQSELPLNAAGTPAPEEQPEEEIGNAQPGTLSEAEIGQAQADALAASSPAPDNVHPIGAKRGTH